MDNWLIYYLYVLYKEQIVDEMLYYQNGWKIFGWVVGGRQINWCYVYWW